MINNLFFYIIRMACSTLPSLKATPILSLDDATSCPMLFSFECNVCLGSSFEIHCGKMDITIGY